MYNCDMIRVGAYDRGQCVHCVSVITIVFLIVIVVIAMCNVIVICKKCVCIRAGDNV